MSSVKNNNSNKDSSRVVATKILAKLLNQNDSLPGLLRDYKSREDYPLIQELCFGTCRWFFLLDWLLMNLLSKPLKKKDQDVRCLLLLGLYQLRFMSLPDYAVMNETVNASKGLKKPWSRSLINGVLRNYLRENESLDQKLEEQPGQIQWAQPPWLASALSKDWPEQLNSVFEASNDRPPMVLRVNTSKISRDDYCDLLREQKIEFGFGQIASSAVYLAKPLNVTELPGFEEGMVSVQDESSQLIPHLLRLEEGQAVLDACAAPGGKTCHILESKCSLSSLVAVDMSQKRSERIQENLNRLGLTAEIKISDVCDLKHWWDGKPFDRILLDAPCSATGIVRRHPDIKVLRTPENVDELNLIQSKILESVWKCLKPGGRLLYTTCSILKSENTEIINKFLQSHADAKYEGIAADWGVECEYGRQLLPTAVDGPDGFFFSQLIKESD